MSLFFCAMSNNSKNIRELLTRCKLSIPFGNKDEWERFAKMYIPCCVLIGIYDDPAEYQRKILESFLTGKGCITIWSVFISLGVENERTGLNKIIKSLVDGHMGAYGFENKTFNNLENILNEHIRNEARNPESHIKAYGLDMYKYRIVSTLIDKTTHGYDIKAELYQDPIPGQQFDDLVEYGIYSMPTSSESNDSSSLSYGPAYDLMKDLNKSLDKKELAELKKEMKEDNISFSIADDSDDDLTYPNYSDSDVPW